MMRAKLINRDESGWTKGDLAYDLDDTLEMGVIKAAQEGIRAGSNEYAAFLTAFSRRVRSKEVSPGKRAAKATEVAPVASAIVLTPDFLKAASQGL